MYRVCVLTSGKYHNVVTGNRYCFFRKRTLELANLFNDFSCAFKIEKLVHNQGVFFWSEGAEETRIIEDMNERGESIYRIITRKEWKEIYR